MSTLTKLLGFPHVRINPSIAEWLISLGPWLHSIIPFALQQLVLCFPSLLNKILKKWNKHYKWAQDYTKIIILILKCIKIFSKEMKQWEKYLITNPTEVSTSRMLFISQASAFPKFSSPSTQKEPNQTQWAWWTCLFEVGRVSLHSSDYLRTCHIEHSWTRRERST